MPSSSKKQHNFMEAIAHSPSFAKKVGVSQSVGRDFSAADKGRKFAKGGDMATKGMNLFKGKESYGEEMKEAKAIKSGKISPMQYAKGEKSEKKMAMGGPMADPRMAAMSKMGAPRQRPAADPRIAAMLAATASPARQARAAKLRNAQAGSQMPPAPMKNGGMAKFASGGFTREADGIAQRGKTQAAQPKMFSAGGYTSAADGIARRGKTQAMQIKMKRGGGC
jgi:hypothetical protein